MTDGKNLFDRPVKNDLDYPYFKEHYQNITIDLSKLQALDADPTVIHQINYTGNLYKAGNRTLLFIIEETK